MDFELKIQEVKHVEFGSNLKRGSNVLEKIP
jgi:hypothetical protein